MYFVSEAETKGTVAYDMDIESTQTAAEIQKARAQKAAGTVAYDMDIESTQTAEEIRATRENKKNNIAGTVAYDMDIESTQSAEEIRADRMKKVNDKAKASDASLDMDNAPTQTFPEDSDGEEHGSALLDLGNEGTMAYEYEEDSDDEDEGGRITPSKVFQKKKDTKAALEEMETQVYDENDEGGTVPVSDTAMLETQAVADTIAVAETQAVGETVAVSDADVSDTVAMAETQAVGDTAPVADTVNVSDTVKASDTVAVSDTIAPDEIATQVFPDNNNAPTQVLGEDPTQILGEEATQVLTEDATQVIEVKSKPKSPVFKTPGRPAPKNIPDSEVATQVFESTQIIEMPPPSSVPKNKGKGKGKTSLPPIDEQPTQVFGANDATQVFEDAVSPPFPDAPTQVFPDAATQVFPAAISQRFEAATQLLDSTQLLNETPVIQVSRKSLAQSPPQQSSSVDTQILGETQTPVLEVYEEPEPEPKKQDAFSPDMCSTQLLDDQVPTLKMDITPDASQGKLGLNDQPTQVSCTGTPY